MDLFVQVGYGMRAMCRELLDLWGEGTAILSPRDNDSGQLAAAGKEVTDRGGQVLIDPQMFDLGATHPTLTGHSYWNHDLYTDTTGLLQALRALNTSAGTYAYLVPSESLAPDGSADWLDHQTVVHAVAGAELDDKPRFATICLESDAVRNEALLERVLEAASAWPVEGYYVVPEHPNGDYMVSDGMWLGNLLTFLAGLKLHGRTTILGYAHQQLLCAATANIDAIASGHFNNVRSFGLDKFQQPDDSIKRKNFYYYCPQTLSDFGIPALDLAFQAGVLPALRPAPAHSNTYSDVLFGGALPSSTAFSEKPSFRHYLHALRAQAHDARKTSFDETVAFHMAAFASAEAQLVGWEGQGVFARSERTIKSVLDASRGGVMALRRARGTMLDFYWS